MQPVYIDCHGFNQFHKVINALYSPDLDLGRFISSVSIEEVYGNNSNFYDRYTVQVLPSDPMFAGSHCHLHEYLMDNLPIPDRFITCVDYNDPADPMPNMFDCNGIFDDIDLPVTYAETMAITDRTID